jgi:hypothetical protein
VLDVAMWNAGFQRMRTLQYYATQGTGANLQERRSASDARHAASERTETLLHVGHSTRLATNCIEKHYYNSLLGNHEIHQLLMNGKVHNNKLLLWATTLKTRPAGGHEHSRFIHGQLPSGRALLLSVR